MQQSRNDRMDPKLNHQVDVLCLSIVFISMFSCLIRSDYNFVLLLFCYFIWQQRKDSQSLAMIIAFLVVLFVMDIFFGIVQIRTWTIFDDGNHIWQTIRPMHNFGIVCFVVQNILKIILLIFAAKGLSNLNKPVQSY